MRYPDLLYTLSDETRLRCLVLLGQGELCVCEFTHALQLSQPKVSRHLAYLRKAGVVEDERRGRWIYYRWHRDLPKPAVRMLKHIAGDAGAQEPYRGDRKRLDKWARRPSARCA